MGYAFSLITRQICTRTIKKIWDKGINRNADDLTKHHTPSHHRRMVTPFILKAHIVCNSNFGQIPIFKTKLVRGCVPEPITAKAI